MKILFVVALAPELKSIKKEVKKLLVPNLIVDFLLVWVGNYNTIYNFKNYLDKNWNPDFVVNMWVCWKIVDVKDIFVQIYRIKNLADWKEKVCPIYLQIWELKSIASSEKIITSIEDLHAEQYVDMESFWIDFVCSKEKIPYIILKFPFDNIWKNSLNVSLSDLENLFLWFNYKKLIEEIKDYLEKNIKNIFNDLDYYKNYFRFTFLEFEIFKKNHNKFTALWFDFDKYFEENSYLSKEIFLENMQKK